MKKVSTKRAKQNREYKKIRDKYLEETPLCDRCKKQASEVHHTGGRNGERLLDESKFMSVCRECHQYIHLNPMESYERGWLIRK